jgi:MarR family transcriptional regulator, lower aerobic nicotinate degradation pathway regulator
VWSTILYNVWMSTLQRVAGRPTWLLGRANARSQALLADAFARSGMRGHHFRLLAALEEHGPASQADLSRTTGIDTSDVVAALNHLAATGYVRRQPDNADRRRNVVSITKAGLVALDRTGRLVDHVQDSVLEPLSADERSTFLRLLAKLT